MSASAKELKYDDKVELEKLLKKLEVLPTLPTIVYELNRLINDPRSSATNITGVMERDQSMTAKVLRLINSAYYGIPGGVSSLQRAIAYLGHDAIYQLIVSATVFKALNKVQASSFNLLEFWKHAVGVAMSAETVAKWAKHKSPADCFTAGLLHDIGKMALYNVSPEWLDRVISCARAESLSVIQAEIQLGLPPHTVVGALLAKQWKLPYVLEATIQFHHEPEPSKRVGVRGDAAPTIDVVYFANSLMHSLKFGNSGHHLPIAVPGPLMTRIQLNATQIPLVLKDVSRCLKTADEFIRLISD